MIQQRSFLIYFLLNFVTCGIYGIFFWYKYAEDMNQVCNGDGKLTQNYILVILLSLVTCGVYYWIWVYGVGNRLQENAPRYGMNLTENGTSILLWMILGSFLCFIGFYYAQYILINNMNMIGDRYNQQFYGGGGFQQQNNQQPPYNNF